VNRLLGPALALLLLAAAAVAQPAPPPVRIVVEAPAPGELVRNEFHQAPLRGVAIAQGGSPLDFDVMLVIDISGSTRAASGADVNRNGHVGLDPRRGGVPAGALPEGALSSDPGDTILAAEVRAAEALLDSLPRSGRVRVGVISFSGELNPRTGKRRRFDQEDAWLEVPLTHDYGAVRAQLPRILARGPYGGTNFAAGLRLAITELAGLSAARSAPRPDARKVVIFLTDGSPTLPAGLGSETDPGDAEAALTAARLAERAGVRVDTYALGPEAVDSPFAATEIARLTGGTYLPVQRPGDIVSFLRAASFANVEDLIFSNLTTREVSTDVVLAPDGSFQGFVPVREGSNRVRVTALTSGGTSASVELDIDFEVAGRSGRELALELERIRQRNKDLMLLLEREPVRRFRERQRKQLELEIEKAPD